MEKPVKHAKHLVSIRLSINDRVMLLDLCAQEGQTITEIISRALRLYRDAAYEDKRIPILGMENIVFEYKYAALLIQRLPHIQSPKYMRELKEHMKEICRTLDQQTDNIGEKRFEAGFQQIIRFKSPKNEDIKKTSRARPILKKDGTPRKLSEKQIMDLMKEQRLKDDEEYAKEHSEK
jgi:hypothetical protein